MIVGRIRNAFTALFACGSVRSPGRAALFEETPMRSRRLLFWALAGLAVSVFQASVACDVKPTGEIVPTKVQTKVGETVPLRLFVRPKFDRLSHEVWKVEPESLGEVYYDGASSTHREAMFRAKSAGSGKIVVDGFFGPPPPHRVAEVSVVVE